MKKLVLLLSFLTIQSVLCRTVSRYVIKKPGDPVPLQKIRNQLQDSGKPYREEIDENVLAQELFKRAKELELEGRIPYQETTKSTVTRTYSAY